MSTATVAQHFTGRSPVVRAIYDRIVDAVTQHGPVREEAKKTSIHLVRRTTCAGIATRKDALILTVKSTTDIKSPRIFKREQVSANRWHLEVKLDDPAQVDKEVKAWLKKSADLAE